MQIYANMMLSCHFFKLQNEGRSLHFFWSTPYQKVRVAVPAGKHPISQNNWKEIIYILGLLDRPLGDLGHTNATQSIASSHNKDRGSSQKKVAVDSVGPPLQCLMMQPCHVSSKTGMTCEFG